LRVKIENDIEILKSFSFPLESHKKTLEVMDMTSLTTENALTWLKERVSYVVSENVTSTLNLLIGRTIYSSSDNIVYPNQDVIPYAIDYSKPSAKDDSLEAINAEKINETKTMTVMSNIGAGLYYAGKSEHKLYTMKISRGLLKKAEHVEVKSPRVGIIQIGEGLFSPRLAMNQEDPNAIANSLFRLAVFFHEARHSDGNGESISFMHSICPRGHQYEGAPACDESLNGPYTVGGLMALEMAKGCNDKCSESDLEMLKITVIDSASRILQTTHKNEKARNWDANPETI
jgi:hypothetical protein